MAKKTSTPKKTDPPAQATKVKVTTPVRQTPIPKAVKPIKATDTPASKGTAAPTFDEIAKRAYELYASGVPGSESDHWFQAERDLRAGV